MNPDRRDFESQRDEVFALAYAALRATDASEVRREAVERIVAAVQGDAAELMRSERGGDELRATCTSGLPLRSVPRSSRVMAAEAVRQDQPVLRELNDEDFRALPELAAAGLRYGIAVPIPTEHVERVAVAYSRDRPFTPDDAALISGCTSVLAAAVERIETEQQLAEREAAMRMLLEQLPALVWTVDTDLVFTMISGGGLPNVVSAAKRNIGKALTDILILEPYGSVALLAHQQALQGEPAGYPFAYYGRMFDVSVEPLRNPDGTMRGCVAVAFDVTDRDRAQRELRASREALRNLTARMQSIEEDERRRVARELHDEMGGRLTALRFELDLLRREIPPIFTPRAEQMAALIHETAEAVRRIATDLRPSVLDDFGLGAAIEHELSSFERRTGIASTLAVPEHEPALDGGQTIAVYRIVQEALTNVARHSGATHVRIELRMEDEQLVVEVTDDGRGITPDQATGAHSLGLVGVRERAYALGGTVEVHGHPGGTRLQLRVPPRRSGSPA
jgi:two-component system sensor histidine kinase UhpB